MEVQAIHQIFQQYARDIVVSPLKSILGECFSASGCLQVASVLGSLVTENIPPAANYQQVDPTCNGLRIPKAPLQLSVRTALVNAFAPHGTNASLILKKVDE